MQLYLNYKNTCIAMFDTELFDHEKIDKDNKSFI